MRLITSLQLMMLSGTWDGKDGKGTQDGKGLGTGESLVDMSGSLGCLLGCLLAWKEINVGQVIVSIE